MPGLSLMQTRNYIDRLGDLDEEITKVCRAADVMCDGAGKDHASYVSQLKEACKALREQQSYVREAKDDLLGFDGFLHALGGELREAMSHPKMSDFFGRISDRMGGPMEVHVGALVEDALEGLRRVGAAVKALRGARQDKERSGSAKESAKALSGVCKAAEKAIRSGLKHSSAPAEPASDEVVVEEEEVVEKKAGEIGFHGYSLTAKKDLPPEFLKNIEKKKEEAKDKKDDDKKSDKKADSQVPGNESKGPKDEGEEDDGWVPGHRTEESDKKAGEIGFHGYSLTAKKGLPPEFLENIKKKKDEAKDKDKKDDKSDESDKKAAEDKDPLGDDTLPPSGDRGEEDPQLDPRYQREEKHSKNADAHGYELFA